MAMAAMAAMATLVSSSFAAEGMWTLDNLPREQMQARYGFNPTPQWVEKVMRASARLAGGCSGSFISPDGLVMTNHHCAMGCLQQLSTPDNDRVSKGFLARERAAELRCPTMEINRLESITDVTDKMQAATAGKQGAAFQAADDAMRAQLTRECRGADAETSRCDMVTLYRGGRYQLYKYHRYGDVRLAWAPEESIAAFGGDPDNFNFPRYNLDATFVRIYENGKPAKVAEYFRFKAAGAELGELTLVTGHPGQTQRLLTVAQLEAARDNMALVAMPGISEFRGVLLQYARQGPEPKRLAMGALEGLENALKVTQGQLEALMEPTLLANKRKAEAELRAFVRARPELQARVGDPWADIERALQARRNLGTEMSMLEDGRAIGTQYFQYARTLVRGAAERSKPNGERLREFTDNALLPTEQRLRSPAPIYPEFEKVRLVWSLNRMRSVLGPDAPLVKQVLGKQSPEQVAAALIDGTQLGKAEERMRLWNGGQSAIEASSDPFIRLALALDPQARALRKRMEAEVQAVEREAAQRVAVASFAQTGPNTYPDATFSLRLSYGEVRGWEEKGKAVPAFTDFAGLYDRVTGEEPFALPESWKAAQSKLKPTQRFNFVSTNDIIGGNSGSPVINRNAEIVGLAFDGNSASHGGAYYFDERVNRTVSVHAGAILESLRVVYQAEALLNELLVPNAR